MYISILKKLFFIISLPLVASCGGGSSSSGTTTTNDSNTAGSLSTEETADINATMSQVWSALAASIISSTSRASLNNQLAKKIRVAGQAAVPCPGGGQFSGGGSASLETDTGFISGQGSASSIECITAGDLNVSGTVSGQFSGTCPGSVKVTITGNLTTYRRGSGGGWVPISNSFGILKNLVVGC